MKTPTQTCLEMSVFGVNDTMSEKPRICNSFPKRFITTPIHVLCSNFSKSAAGKWNNGRHCVLDKIIEFVLFSRPWLTLFGSWAPLVQCDRQLFTTKTDFGPSHQKRCYAGFCIMKSPAFLPNYSRNADTQIPFLHNLPLEQLVY